MESLAAGGTKRDAGRRHASEIPWTVEKVLELDGGKNVKKRTAWLGALITRKGLDMAAMSCANWRTLRYGVRRYAAARIRMMRERLRNWLTDDSRVSGDGICMLEAPVR